MVAYAFLIIFIIIFVRYLLIILTIYAARKIEINKIITFFSRIRLFIILYAFKIMRKLLFWSVLSFLSIILRAVIIFCGVYYIDAPKVSASLIIKV